MVVSLTLRTASAKDNVCPGLQAGLLTKVCRPAPSPHAPQITPNGIIITKFVLVKKRVVNRKLLLVFVIVDWGCSSGCTRKYEKDEGA